MTGLDKSIFCGILKIERLMTHVDALACCAGVVYVPLAGADPGPSNPGGGCVPLQSGSVVRRVNVCTCDRISGYGGQLGVASHAAKEGWLPRICEGSQ